MYVKRTALLVNIWNLVNKAVSSPPEVLYLHRIMRTLLLGGGTLLKETTLLGVGV